MDLAIAIINLSLVPTLSVNEVDLDYENYSYMQENQNKSHLNQIIFIKMIFVRLNCEWTDYSELIRSCPVQLDMLTNYWNQLLENQPKLCLPTYSVSWKFRISAFNSITFPSHFEWIIEQELIYFLWMVLFYSDGINHIFRGYVWLRNF